MKTVTLRILRVRPAMKPCYEEFKVESDEKTTILDCLHFVKDNYDRTLSFRDTCRSGICGACGVMVNNEAGLACKTSVQEIGSDILTIEPLKHFPVIKDLMVDFDEFFEKLKKVSPWILTDSVQERNLIDEETVLALRKIGHCLYCGVCYAESSLVEKNKDFVGPHAMAKVARYLGDPREKSRERVKIAQSIYLPFKDIDEKDWDLPCPTDIDFMEVKKILEEVSN
jgi:succinate dehydrogenase/fumarate reductase iron-sulfur protein